MTTITLLFCDVDFPCTDEDIRKAGVANIEALINLFTCSREHQSSADFTNGNVIWHPYPLHPGAIAPKILMHVVVHGDYPCRPSWVSDKDLTDYKKVVLNTLRNAFGSNVPNDFKIEFEFKSPGTLLSI